MPFLISVRGLEEHDAPARSDGRALRRRLGAWLALVATPLAFVLGVGFALPLMLIGVPARVLLLIAGRRALR